MHGYGYPYAPPPPPPKQGLSPLAIVLIVGAVVFALGAGSCVVLGGLILLGASAEEEASPDGVARSGKTPAMPNTSLTGTGDVPSPPSPPEEPSDQGGDDPSSGLASSGSGAANAPPTPTAPSPSKTKYFCNATGWVRVCGFANVCSNQMVSGMGTGNDQFTASQMARNACQGMAIAKGGSTVCTVACSAR